MRLTHRKLAQAVPVAGAVIGAGLNAHLLSTIADDAEHLYRERFLREKYGIPPVAPADSRPGADTVAISEIVDAEIVDDAEDAVDEDAGDDATDKG